MQPRVDSELAECFYEGISKPYKLAQGLQRLGEKLGCDRISLNIWDRRGQWGMASHALRGSGDWQLKIVEGELPDPAMRMLMRKFDPGHWTRCGYLRQEGGKAGRAASPESTRAALLCTRIALTNAEAMLTLQRPDGGWDDAPADVKQATQLSRALLPALDPIAKLRHLGRQVAHQSSMLDSVRMPMILVDASQRPLVVNAAAASIFSIASNASGRKALASLPGVPASRFAQFVQQACSQPAAGGVLTFRLREDMPAAHLLVLPLRVARGGLSQPAALVLVQGLNGLPEQSQLLLQRVYGLTPAEARLAQLILDGQSPVDAATTLQVSVATIRTQLSAVLKKTGAQRQSDLVRQLSPLLILNHSAVSSTST